jgi:hypothetical protein
VTRALGALSLALSLGGCGARDGLLMDAPPAPPVPPDAASAGACDELLWPGASVPIDGYCMDRASRAATAAPTAAQHAWSVETPSRNHAWVLIDDRGRIYSLVSTSDAFDDRRLVVALEPDGRSAWTLELAGPPSGGLVLMRDRTLLAIVNVLGDYRVVSVDRDGQLLAEHPLPPTTGSYTMYGVGPQSTLYFVAHGASPKVVATDALARPIWWSEPFEGSPRHFALNSRGELIVPSSGSPSRLTSIGPDGRTRWSTELAGFPLGLYPSIGPDDRIYMVLDGPTLIAPDVLHVFSPDGLLLRSTPFEIPLYGDLAIALDGSVYLRSRDGVIGLAPDGSLRWTYPEHPNTEHGITVDALGRVLLTPDTVLLDPETGSVLWQASVPAGLRDGHVFFPDRGVLGKHGIVFTDAGGFFHGVR